MPTVPIYERTARARPILQQNITAQASASDFGAQVGQGLQNVAQGIGNLGDAYDQVEALKAETAAREARNAWMRDKDDLTYNPETGYMNQSGRNALDTRKAYEDKIKGLRTKYVEGLNPRAARMFNQAVDGLETDTFRSSAIHNGNEMKQYVIQEGVAGAENFQNEALRHVDNPAMADKYLAAGLRELQEVYRKQGLPPEAIVAKEREFLSGSTKQTALTLAAKGNAGILAAQDYIEKNKDRLSAADKLALDGALAGPIAEAQGAAAVKDILNGGRKVADLPGDIVSDVAGVSKQPRGGPTRSKAFLASISSNKDRPGDTSNLDDAFADNLSSLIQDAPESIRKGLGLGSGWRSNERQKELFANSDGTGRTVAFPAGYQKPDGSIAKGSNHLRGRAVDLTWNGMRLDKAPKEVRDWVHANAGNYGLRFPMSWEPWHIEPTKGTTVVPSRDGVSARATMPSYSDAIARINQIENPDVRAAAIKQLNAQFELRGKAESANAADAKSQIWAMMMQNTPLSQVPLQLKIDAGREAVSGFMEFESKAGEIKTDPAAYSSLTNMAAVNPLEFAKIDLTAPEIINSLSREDWKSLSNTKNSILGDEAKAVRDGSFYSAAFKQADQALSAAGLTTPAL